MENILTMQGITKTFPGVVALDNVDFDLRRGEVHVLLGENGAGKSTLIKVLAGVYPEYSGKIILDGNDVIITKPKDALNLGVRIIYQELMLNENITITENIFQGREIVSKGIINWKEMYRQAQSLIDDLKYPLNAKMFVKDLGIAKKQIVEIIKAISSQSKIIVFDEPTASLSPSEIECLFGIIRNLKEKGHGIIYISHRMSELFALGDRVTVLRDGEKIETRNIASVGQEELIAMVSGKKIEQIHKECFATDEVVLEVEKIPTVVNKEEGITFSLHKGEILGITGLVGAGKTELARSLCGIDNTGHRTVKINGIQHIIKSYQKVVQYGMAYLSEDRRGEGLVLMRSVKDNVSLATMEKVVTRGIIDTKKETELAKRFIHKLSLKTPNEKTPVKNLSGGNQQKVVIIKWLVRDSEILIFDEPTRGIDVAAKEEIYHIMFTLAKQGKSILMISSDIDEILRITDRIIVISDGKKSVELTDVQTLSKDSILNYSFGVN
jgi:ribose transport system ATP-binding protein